MSGTDSPSDTDGHLPTYQPIVPVELACYVVEHASHAWNEAYQLQDTMRSETP